MGFSMLRGWSKLNRSIIYISIKSRRSEIEYPISIVNSFMNIYRDSEHNDQVVPITK